MSKLLISTMLLLGSFTATAMANDTIHVVGAKMTPGTNMQAKSNDGGILEFVLQDRDFQPFCQSAVLQSTTQAKQGPKAEKPFFHVRCALPIPPVYTKTDVAALTGIDIGVYRHNHSPGFEVADNGDALAIYFSTPAGKAEKDTSTTFVQARLRYGCEDWDMPELFFATERQNDQSGLLWNDNGTLWFFGGGRDISDYVPFRIAKSIDNGATWTYTIPILNSPAKDYTAQPICNAFRGKDGAIYMAMDADGSQSFLWRSTDEGKTWTDMGGRTGGRHSTIVPLDDKGTLLSIGGKNANVDGWTPKNISTDWGKTWSQSESIHFPQLSSGQRPSMIRLQSGSLVFVSDGYLLKRKIAPPASWKKSHDAFIAISKDNGKTWRVKTLPVGLPQDGRPQYTSLGYSTVRQAPNGTIHILATKDYPGIHYELNEAWIWSDAGAVKPEQTGGKIRNYSENYSDGKLKSKWSARICPNGRYLLHGEQVDYYPSGRIQHQVSYVNGRKSGVEIFWDELGRKVWQWNRDLKTNRGTWTHYWKNGNKKIVSEWDIYPKMRDRAYRFFGYVADGDACHYDKQGKLTNTYHFDRGVIQEK